MLKFFKVHIYQSHLQDHRLLLLHHLHRLGHLPPPRHPLPPLPKFKKNLVKSLNSHIVMLYFDEIKPKWGWLAISNFTKLVIKWVASLEYYLRIGRQWWDVFLKASPKNEKCQRQHIIIKWFDHFYTRMSCEVSKIFVYICIYVPS